MRIIRTRVSVVVFLACCVAVKADAPVDKIIYVEPPLRVLTQCEFYQLSGRTLRCKLAGWPHHVTLAPGIGLWKGRDTKDLRVLQRGDLLDIKLGLDADSREVATFIWANLVRLEGVMGVQYNQNWMRVFPLVPFSIGELSKEPMFAFVDGETKLHGTDNAARLQPGIPVIVIGERIGKQRVRATRLISARQ